MRALLLALPLVGCASTDLGWDVPEGYDRVYGQDFATQGALAQFDFTEPAAWGWHMDTRAVEDDPPAQHMVGGRAGQRLRAAPSLALDHRPDRGPAGGGLRLPTRSQEHGPGVARRAPGPVLLLRLPGPGQLLLRAPGSGP